MNIYGIYDTENNEQCIRVGDIVRNSEVFEFDSERNEYSSKEE